MVRTDEVEGRLERRAAEHLLVVSRLPLVHRVARQPAAELNRDHRDDGGYLLRQISLLSER